MSFGSFGSSSNTGFGGSGGGFGNAGGGFGSSGGGGGSLFGGGGGNAGGGFGASNTGGGFGASGGGFGSNTGASGGGSGFSFGSSNAGGAGGFGASNTGGGFGASNTGGGFGASNTGGGFGASNTGGGFGASSTSGGFGASNTGGGFGASSTGGGFGASSTSGGFGSPSQPNAGGFGSTGGFGSSNTSSGGFGSTPNSGGGGLFGSSSTTNASSFGGFGSTSGSTGGFGATNTGGAGGFGTGGGFGSSGSAATGATGTAIAPFQPTMDSASNSNESFMTITAMNQYANKSVEQLRFEDYAAGRRPGATGNAAGGFGTANTSGGGLFGSSNTNTAGGGGGLFGSSNTGGGGGGLFGSSGNAGASTGFGATSNQSGGLFSSGASNAGGFGASGGFGSPAQQNTGGGLFGSSGNTGSTGGSLFGGGNANSGGGGGLFGSSSGSTGFGASNTQGGGLFGSSNTQQQQQQQQTTGGGLFGGSTNNAGGFGSSNTGGGLFGGQNTSNMGGGGGGGGLFGSSSGTNTGGGGGLFGSSGASTGGGGGGLFGGSNTNTGGGGGGLFGGSNTNTGGGGFFGSSNTNTGGGGGLFGGSSTTSGGGGLFGGSNTNTNTGGGGLFGGSNTNTGGGGLFGSSNTNTGGGGGLFGGSSTNAGGGGLFGGSNTNTGGGGGLFGGGGMQQSQPQQQQAGAFGSSSLFGSSQGSSFAPQMQQQQQMQNQMQNPMQNPMQAQNNQLLTQQQALALTSGEPYATGPSSQMARHIALAKEAWQPVANDESKSRGDDIGDRVSRHSGSVSKSDVAKTPSRGATSTPIGKVQIRPRGYGRTYGAVASMLDSESSATPESSLRLARTASASSSSTPGTASKPAKGADKLLKDKAGNGVLSPGVFDLNKRLSIKKANRKSTPLRLAQSQTAIPALASSESQGPDDIAKLVDGAEQGSPRTAASNGKKPKGAAGDDRENGNEEAEGTNAIHETPSRTGSSSRLRVDKSSSHRLRETARALSNDLDGHGRESLLETPARTTIRSPDEGPSGRAGTASRSARRKAPVSKHCPRMSKALADEGYSTSPPLWDLEQMTDAELEAVPKFRIQRDGFGSVEWLGKVDVRDLDIDASVSIEPMSIEVYKSEDETPARGTKLNRPAICTIEHMEIPADFEGTNQEFGDWLREYTPQLDAVFIDYDLDDCVWTFKVKHFTRYGFTPGASTPYPRSGKRTSTKPAPRADEQEEPLVTSGAPDDAGAPDALGHDPRDASAGAIPAESATAGYAATPAPRNARNAGVADQLSMAMSPAYTPRLLSDSTPRPLSPMLTPFGQPVRAQASTNPAAEEQTATFASRLPPARAIHFEDIPIEEGPTFRIFREAKCASTSSARAPVRRLHRGFRASWGPGGKLVFPDGAGIRMMKLNVDDPTPADENRIRIVLDSCRAYQHASSAGEVEDPACRVLASAVDDLVDATQDAAQDMATAIERKVWTLVRSSWFVGQQGLSPDQLPDADDANAALGWRKWRAALPRESPCAKQKQRLMSQEWLDSHDTWLKGCLRAEAPEYLDSVAGALSLKDVERACELAMDRGDLRLATLVSQAAGDRRVRELIASQIHIWERSGAHHHVDRDLLNVYHMLAGDIGHEQSDKEQPWLRALALHAWFVHDPLARLEDSLDSYTVAFRGGSAPEPRPEWYNEHDCESCFDTVYQLLQLACRPGEYSMHDVLNPRGYTSNILTTGLAWALWQVLRTFGVVGGNGLDLLQEHQLGMAYILELEAKGQWQLAVAVAQFLPDEVLREDATRILLDRYEDPAAAGAQAKADFIAGLGIPDTWIAQSRAQRCGYDACLGPDEATLRRDEADNYALAENLAERCRVIDQHMATRDILNGDTESLRGMLAPNEDQIKSAAKAGAAWARRSLVYLDYTTLRHLMGDILVNTEEVPQRLHDIRERCSDLQSSLLGLQADPATALGPALAAEIGTWLQLRATEMLRIENKGQSTELVDYETALLVPSHEKSLRTAVGRYTISFVESFVDPL